MREMERDGEHIWLRQSVTFTAAGQTRTVEIAIPLRPGASAEDVEALLREADAGMERLSRRLDDRVSALLNGSPAATAAETQTPPPAAATAPAAPSEPQQTASRAEHPQEPAAPPPSPAPRTAPARTAAATPSEATSARPAASAPSRPAPQTARPPATSPSPSTPAPARARLSGPLAEAQPAPQGPDLTRPEFIAAAQELGLNVKQAMDRLGVRSLEGLNLREALEALRRQAVRGDSTPATSARSAAPSSPPASAPERAQPAEPRYFDEEDDLDVTFSVDGDDELEEEAAPYEAGTPTDEGAFDPLEELDEDDLDDVPDFGPPPSASRGASSRRANTAQLRPAPSPAPAEAPGEQESAGASGDRARGLQILGQLRAASGGGAPTSYQRTAYRNIVARELGEPEAAALVRGVWRTTPERLTAEQLDALVSWGKQDTFGEEAALVLATLRAGRERANSSGDQQPAASAAPRPGPRGRSAGSTGSGRNAPGGR